MTHTRIYGALIVIAISLALFLLIFFGVNIKVSKNVNIYYNSIETNTVYVALTNKQHKYVSNQDTNKKYSIVNPLNKDDVSQVKLTPYEIKEDSYIYRFNTPSTWSDTLVGAYSTSFTFGDMKLFQYFVWF